jgi:hypothetical protein
MIQFTISDSEASQLSDDEIISLLESLGVYKALEATKTYLNGKDIHKIIVTDKLINIVTK